MCVHVCVHMYHSVCVKVRVQFIGSKSLLPNVGLGNQTQIVSLGDNQDCFTVDHLITAPWLFLASICPCFKTGPKFLNHSSFLWLIFFFIAFLSFLYDVGLSKPNDSQGSLVFSTSSKTLFVKFNLLL